MSFDLSLLHLEEASVWRHQSPYIPTMLRNTTTHQYLVYLHPKNPWYSQQFFFSRNFSPFPLTFKLVISVFSIHAEYNGLLISAMQQLRTIRLFYPETENRRWLLSKWGKRDILTMSKTKARNT